MSKEEIRKLLGGYATNTLNESERSALFEAALDDQELFDALQQEQALKNLLADPQARSEIRQALDRPTPQELRAGPVRWWLWSGAISAVAAAVVLAVVFWPRPVAISEQPVQIASTEKAPSPIASDQSATPKTVAPQRESDALKRQPHARSTRGAAVATTGALSRSAVPAPASPATSAELARAPIAAPIPAPVIPPPVQLEAAQQPLQQQAPGSAGAGQTGQAQIQGTLGGVPQSPPVANRFTALSSAAKASPATALRYSLLKRDANTNNFAPVSEADLKPGDLVRVQVSSAVPGRVILFQRNRSGEWQNIADVPVAANSAYAIPGAAILVPGDAEQFRLTLDPSVSLATDAESRSKSTARSAPATPVTVEFTIGGKRPN